MICNIDYIDPSNNQFILKDFNNLNKKNNNIKYDTINIIKNMINNFDKKIIESFCNHNKNNNYFIIIILFILFILFLKFIM